MRTSEIPKQEEPPTNIKIAILKQDDKEMSLPPLPPPVFSSPQKQQLSSAPTSLTPGEEMFYTPRNLSRINDQTNYGTSVIRSSVPIPRSVPPNPSTAIETIKISTNKAVTSSDEGVAAVDRITSSHPDNIAPAQNDTKATSSPNASTAALTRKLEKAKTVIGKLKEENKALNEQLQSLTASIQEKQTSNEEQLQRELQKQKSKMSDLITENESLNLQNISLCQNLVRTLLLIRLLLPL